MRGIFGDRFLRRFAGGLKNRRKHPYSTGEGQNPEAEADAAPWPETVGPDVNSSEEDHEESVAEDAGAVSAGADANDALSKAEPAEQNEIEPKAD